MKIHLKKPWTIFNRTFLDSLKSKKKQSPELRNEFIPIPLWNYMKSSFFLMKFLFVIFLMSGFSVAESNAQILKKIDRKVEQKVDKTIDRTPDVSENETKKSLKATQDKELYVANTKTIANNSNAAYNVTTAAPTTANLVDGLVMIDGDCTDFIWFKEGATMKFEVQNGKGKRINESQLKVEKVYKKDAVTIADVHMSDNEKNEFTMQFKCDGDKLYMDFASAIEQVMAKSNPGNKDAVRQAGENMEMGFSDGFMSFPKNMHPGQELDDAVFTMKTKSGNVGMNITTSLTGRKVVAKEKITTPAGTFDCVKVIGNRSTTMSLLGKERNMGKPTQEFVWISPVIGTIKQENYTAKGKLESMSQLIEFKM